MSVAQIDVLSIYEAIVSFNKYRKTMDIVNLKCRISCFMLHALYHSNSYLSEG